MRNRISHKKQHVINRSGSKNCDICECKEILETHHIEGRKIPNFNHSSNLCSICPNCHTKVHHGKIIIEKWMKTTNGLKLFWHSGKEESFSGIDSKTHII